MSHFAKVENGIVVNVIVAEEDFIQSGSVGNPDDWIRTSYNTQNNQHQNGTPLRGNYAGVGYIYDKDNDVFYPPQPFNSWILDENTWSWQSPISYPNDDKDYSWDEDSMSWVEVNVDAQNNIVE